MKLVITAATANEVNKIKLRTTTELTEGVEDILISFHVSGVGILSTCYSLSKLINDNKPDLIIQAGIAGCFDSDIFLTEVVTVKQEITGDIGVEENGIFQDLFDMKFQQENQFPYINKNLVNPWLPKYNLPGLKEVTGITVNEVSTRTNRIDQLRFKYKPVVESMEGAALHYVCLQTGVPFIQIRCISNYVGERDKSKWKFNEAFDSLTDVVLRYLGMLAQASL